MSATLPLLAPRDLDAPLAWCAGVPVSAAQFIAEARAILDLRLRQLAKLEEIRIRTEQDELGAERDRRVLEAVLDERDVARRRRGRLLPAPRSGAGARGVGCPSPERSMAPGRLNGCCVMGQS